MPRPQPSADPAFMRRQLLGWYARHRRHLPWRAEPGETPDAYRVWVSEIMLQQTRVATAIPYYERFLQRFPDVAALAHAPLPEVLAAWSGLGYYRRARQLHQAAQRIVAQHHAQFPLDPAAARALPGIGAYTTGAILSIAAGFALAAVDGNGLRIARRLTGRALTLPEANRLWTQWLSPRRPGAFNQAVMDLGATVCTPRDPRCGACPLRRACRAPGPAGKAAVASRPAPRAPRQSIEACYGWLRRGEKVWLCQRPADARQMPGLWELPAVSGRADAVPLATLRHTITNTRITARVYALNVAVPPRPSGATRAKSGEPPPSGLWMTRPQALAAPLTGLTRKILLRLWPERPPAPPPASKCAV